MNFVCFCTVFLILAPFNLGTGVEPQPVIWVSLTRGHHVYMRKIFSFVSTKIEPASPDLESPRESISGCCTHELIIRVLPIKSETGSKQFSFCSCQKKQLISAPPRVYYTGQVWLTDFCFLLLPWGNKEELLTPSSPSAVPRAAAQSPPLLDGLDGTHLTNYFRLDSEK